MRTTPTPRAGWRLFLARAVRATLVVSIVAAAVLVDAGTAEAIRIPSTLADRRSVQTGPVEPGFPIDYLGVLWDTPDYQSVAAGQDHEDEAHGAVRFRHDGVWGPWVLLVEDGADAPGQWASGLIPAGDADAYQVRGLPAGAILARAVPARRVRTRSTTARTPDQDPAGIFGLSFPGCQGLACHGPAKRKSTSEANLRGETSPRPPEASRERERSGRWRERGEEGSARRGAGLNVGIRRLGIDDARAGGTGEQFATGGQ